jgi:hypothetical protein
MDLNKLDLESLQACFEDEERNNKIDKNVEKVNHPSHYTQGKIEVIEYLEDQGWAEGFCLGNAVKYISRAGHKQDFVGQDQMNKTIEDLSKARWYLDRYIKYLENKKN